MQQQDGMFDTLTQRAVCSYMRALATSQIDQHDGWRELYTFLKELYQAMYDSPALFGLPEAPDDCIREDEKDRTGHLAALNRGLKKPRDTIAIGLFFLTMIGAVGKSAVDDVSGAQLLLVDHEDYATILKDLKVKKPFLAGLAQVGLAIDRLDACVLVRSPRFPEMLHPMKGLALSSDMTEDLNLGRFNFARCKFISAGESPEPDALELYRYFSPAAYARAARLHEYFLSQGYKPLVSVHDVHAWQVQYQGRRQVKSTPLVQIEYSERFHNPLRAQIKCASANRIAPLLSRQPRLLQADFFQRTFACSDCGWCKNKKNMGPSLIEFEGRQKRVCWYVLPELKELDDDAVTLVQQYAGMHEELG